MASFARYSVFALALLFAGVVYAQGRSWIPDQGSLQPGEGKSPVQVKIPDPRPIKAPGPEVPEGIRGLSGRWLGWARADRQGSVAIDVEELTAKGGTFAYYYSEPGFTTSFAYRASAVIVGGHELEGSIGGGTFVKLRLRPDGHADFMVYWNQRFRSGVLSRQ